MYNRWSCMLTDDHHQENLKFFEERAPIMLWVSMTDFWGLYISRMPAWTIRMLILTIRLRFREVDELYQVVICYNSMKQLEHTAMLSLSKFRMLYPSTNLAFKSFVLLTLLCRVRNSNTINWGGFVDYACHWYYGSLVQFQIFLMIRDHIWSCMVMHGHARPCVVIRLLSNKDRHRIYLKDNFGYGVTTSLPNALQQVAGVEITAQCHSSHDATSLPSLWFSTFLGLSLNALQINNTGAGALLASIAQDASHAVIKTSSNSTYVPFNTTSMSFSWTSMYAVVNASGNATVNDTSMVPAPVGRAVYATVRGIAQAIRFGVTLDATTAGYPSAADILQCLLADGLKAALTAHETQAVQENWCFGNEHRLGVLAIMLTLGFRVYALGVVLTVQRRPRVHRVDPFKVVDGFKIGLDAAKGGDEATGFWAVDHGILVARGEHC
ncbi:hypothetical protein C8R45DRAFT_923252 [Mycena sanguinolenta]|nr:hypothetical protein C8R45DRAFT_923252 [Mycena sanguinolenta]